MTILHKHNGVCNLLTFNFCPEAQCLTPQGGLLECAPTFDLSGHLPQKRLECHLCQHRRIRLHHILFYSDRAAADSCSSSEADDCMHNSFKHTSATTAVKLAVSSLSYLLLARRDCRSTVGCGQKSVYRYSRPTGALSRGKARMKERMNKSGTAEQARLMRLPRARSR